MPVCGFISDVNSNAIPWGYAHPITVSRSYGMRSAGITPSAYSLGPRAVTMSGMCAERLPFFDFSKAKGPRRGPDVGQDVTADLLGKQPQGQGPMSAPNEGNAANPSAAGEKPAGGVTGAAAGTMTVTALVARIKKVLSEGFVERVHVVGEISNLKNHTSGHLYFRLKDAGATIDAVMFRTAAAKMKFRPTDGLEVVAEGRVDVYDSRGQLQLYVERMTPKGAGALELAFQQLREKLQREGLFDPAHKIPLPLYPRAIGVVTSPTGAAVRDICKTLRRRWPAAAIYLAPALVQGEGAAASVAAGIALLDGAAERLGIDTIIIGRGGGSLEDLWAFNEEAVARAIFACRTPIISGVGHEVDVTISDLVADVRAATPTGAAELAVPDSADVRRHTANLSARLARAVGEDLLAARRALEAALRSVVFRDPGFRLRTHVQRIDELCQRLRAALREELSRSRRRLERPANRLAALHPARLHERCGARLEQVVGRMRWALGARSKRAGDALAALEARLAAANPRQGVAMARQKLNAIERQLRSMGYGSVLNRGFSITRGPDGAILRRAQDIPPGQVIETELAEGKLTSRVDGPARSTGPSPATPPQQPPPAARHKKPRPDDDGQPKLF